MDHLLRPSYRIAPSLRIDSPMSNCCSHGTFLHFSLQSSHLNICYYPVWVRGMWCASPAWAPDGLGGGWQGGTADQRRRRRRRTANERRAYGLRKSTKPNGRAFSQRRIKVLRSYERPAKAKCKTGARGERGDTTRGVAATAAPAKW